MSQKSQVSFKINFCDFTDSFTGNRNNSVFKMSASDRAKLKPAIELFCPQNNTKAHKYETY